MYSRKFAYALTKFIQKYTHTEFTVTCTPKKYANKNGQLHSAKFVLVAFRLNLHAIYLSPIYFFHISISDNLHEADSREISFSGVHGCVQASINSEVVDANLESSPELFMIPMSVLK